MTTLYDPYNVFRMKAVEDFLIALPGIPNLILLRIGRSVTWVTAPSSGDGHIMVTCSSGRAVRRSIMSRAHKKLAIVNIILVFGRNNDRNVQCIVNGRFGNRIWTYSLVDIFLTFGPRVDRSVQNFAMGR